MSNCGIRKRVFKKQIEKGEFYLGDSIPAKVHLQLQTELQEGGSPKIREACNIARALAKETGRPLRPRSAPKVDWGLPSTPVALVVPLRSVRML